MEGWLLTRGVVAYSRGRLFDNSMFRVGVYSMGHPFEGALKRCSRVFQIILPFPLSMQKYMYLTKVEDRSMHFLHMKTWNFQVLINRSIGSIWYFVTDCMFC